LIIRHRLQKKDPVAPMSEPVKPIIYYLDNGTPEPIRSALLEGHNGGIRRLKQQDIKMLSR
jgi:hypothetical protein